MADVERRFDVIDPTTTGVYGSICYYEGMKGWLFISMVSSHGNGRTARATPEAAMPPWAKKRGAILQARHRVSGGGPNHQQVPRT